MAENLKRFCVLCGKPPVEKTNEHVIPRWLIEMTGDPKRPIHVGPFINHREPFQQFAFDQFRFPACSSCNDTYAKVESQVKHIMENLLGFSKVSAQDFDVLLDWFDKVSEVDPEVKTQYWGRLRCDLPFSGTKFPIHIRRRGGGQFGVPGPDELAATASTDLSRRVSKQFGLPATGTFRSQDRRSTHSRPGRAPTGPPSPGARGCCRGTTGASRGR
jgi:hypothetical protein